MEEIFVLKTLFNINDISDTILVDGAKLIPGPLDLLSFNVLNVWSDIVLGAEVQELLSGLDTTDQRAGNRFSLEDQRKLADTVRCCDGSELNKSAGCFNTSKIDIQIMFSGNSVQNHIALSVLCGN